MKVLKVFWTVSNSCLNWFIRFECERPKSRNIQKVQMLYHPHIVPHILGSRNVPIINNAILGVRRICWDFEMDFIEMPCNCDLTQHLTIIIQKKRSTNSYSVYLSVCLTVVVAKNRRVVVCCQFAQLSLPKSFLLQFVLVLLPFIQLNCWNIK